MFANVAELVDALDLGSSGVTRESSSLSVRIQFWLLLSGLIMQVSVEKVSNVEHRLTVTVPAEVVAAAYNRQIEQYARKAKVDGFRPGKAPRARIEQLYGMDARQSALSEVIQSSLDEAITKEKLKPIDQPRVEPKSLLADQPLEYVATV